jgi:hypothetical protein
VSGCEAAWQAARRLVTVALAAKSRETGFPTGPQDTILPHFIAPFIMCDLE